MKYRTVLVKEQLYWEVIIPCNENINSKNFMNTYGMDRCLYSGDYRFFIKDDDKFLEFMIIYGKYISEIKPYCSWLSDDSIEDLPF